MPESLSIGGSPSRSHGVKATRRESGALGLAHLGFESRQDLGRSTLGNSGRSEPSHFWWMAFNSPLALMVSMNLLTQASSSSWSLRRATALGWRLSTNFISYWPGAIFSSSRATTLLRPIASTWLDR